MAAFDARPLKAQLRMADRFGAAHAVIVGEREADAGTVTLRRLEDGRQEELSVADLLRWLAPPAGGADGS
jgi:histidyl-tRNA synthetase